MQDLEQFIEEQLGFNVPEDNLEAQLNADGLGHLQSMPPLRTHELTRPQPGHEYEIWFSGFINCWEDHENRNEFERRAVTILKAMLPMITIHAEKIRYYCGLPFDVMSFEAQNNKCEYHQKMIKHYCEQWGMLIGSMDLSDAILNPSAAY